MKRVTVTISNLGNTTYFFRFVYLALQLSGKMWHQFAERKCDEWLSEKWMCKKKKWKRRYIFRKCEFKM